MAFVLVSAAFLGLAMVPGVMAVPGDIDEPFQNDDIIEGAGIDMDYAYITSAVTLQINHTLMGKSANFFPVLFTIIVTDDVTDWELYRWTDTDGVLVNPYNWTMNMTTAGDYTIRLSAVFYETVDGDYWGDSIDIGFTVYDGTNMITDVETDKATVLNDGADSITISFTVGRDEADIADIQMNIYNEWLVLAGGDGFVFENNLTAGDLTATPGTGSTDYSYTWNVPMGMLAGYISSPYDVVINVTDDWGYNEEVYSDDLFEVEWMELAPYLVDGEIQFDEDSYALVDLDDHIEDINGDDITYFINLTELYLMESNYLMVDWVDETTINVTAASNWNGEGKIKVWANDGMYNESMNLTFTVDPVEDDLMVSMYNTVFVNEAEMEATFSALDFFEDPDGPINLTVSLGFEEIIDNVTGNATWEPIWMYEDENITIELNQTDLTNSMAYVNVDVEEGEWSFNISAWIDGEWVMNGTAMVEIVPVNDVPMLATESVDVFKNEEQTINLSEYFADPDGPKLNLTVDTTVTGATLDYDWETFMLGIVPDNNWTGAIEVSINATDGEDYDLYTFTINVILRSYAVTGTVTFEEVTGVSVNMSNVTLMIGGEPVALDDVNAFSIILDEGEYEVALAIPEEYLYNESAAKSGYVMPTIENINLTAPATRDITVEYMVYVAPTPTATWDDINWTTKMIEDDDGTIVITVGVDNPEYLGYEDLFVEFIIQDEDEVYNFTMTWDNATNMFVLELTEDELEDIPEGEQTYYFTDGTNESPEYEYEFTEKDENANLITVIVLIVLIILVLIALVFIMRKPSEEEFDEEDEEEEEEGERSCPSCGETVTDEEAGECPYCGENLEE